MNFQWNNTINEKGISLRLMSSCDLAFAAPQAKLFKWLKVRPIFVVMKRFGNL
jgi:hypothetical protein